MVPRGKLWDKINNKGFPEPMITSIQTLYFNTRIKTGRGTGVSNTEITYKARSKTGCPMYKTLFNIFIYEVIRQWQDVVTEDFKTGHAVYIQSGYFIESEDDLQGAVSKIKNIAVLIRELQLRKKDYGFSGENCMRCKIIIDNKTIE
jgi:hypothetical protein